MNIYKEKWKIYQSARRYLKREFYAMIVDPFVDEIGRILKQEYIVMLYVLMIELREVRDGKR